MEKNNAFNLFQITYGCNSPKRYKIKNRVYSETKVMSGLYDEDLMG